MRQYVFNDSWWLLEISLQFILRLFLLLILILPKRFDVLSSQINNLPYIIIRIFLLLNLLRRCCNTPQGLNGVTLVLDKLRWCFLVAVFIIVDLFLPWVVYCEEDLGAGQQRQFHGLLEEALFPFVKCDLLIMRIKDIPGGAVCCKSFLLLSSCDPFLLFSIYLLISMYL